MKHFGKLWNNYTRPKFQYVIREFKILQNMAYVQNGLGYTLKCDKCGTLLHREGKDKPFLSLDIDELDSVAKEYGWLINKRVHKCTYCRTFKK